MFRGVGLYKVQGLRGLGGSRMLSAPGRVSFPDSQKLRQNTSPPAHPPKQTRKKLQRDNPLPTHALQPTRSTFRPYLARHTLRPRHPPRELVARSNWPAGHEGARSLQGTPYTLNHKPALRTCRVQGRFVGTVAWASGFGAWSSLGFRVCCFFGGSDFGFYGFRFAALLSGRWALGAEKQASVDTQVADHAGTCPL